MAKEKVFKSYVHIEKFDEELGIIWGFASVADIVDLQDEVIEQEELLKFIYKFMELYYQGKAEILENHEDEVPVVLVESFPMFLATKLRWWIGVKLLSDELKEKARNGEVKGFSIGGYAEKEEI